MVQALVMASKKQKQKNIDFKVSMHIEGKIIGLEKRKFHQEQLKEK